MRTLVDIPDDDIAGLEALAKRNNRSRAAEIREAIKLHVVSKSTNDWIERWAGLWAGRDDIPDGVEYQRAMREDRRPYEDI